MRDSVLFYRSFYDALKNIPCDERLKVYDAIMEYGMYDTEPELDGVALAIFLLAKPQIDANNKRYKNGCAAKQKKTVSKIEANCKQDVSKAEANGKQNRSEAEAKEKEKEKEKVKEKVNKIFKPPTVAEVKAYCDERRNAVDPQSFVDFYESKGWMIGKNKMKDWKAAVRTWEKNETKTRLEGTAKLVKDNNNFARRNYDMDDLERRLLT